MDGREDVEVEGLWEWEKNLSVLCDVAPSRRVVFPEGHVATGIGCQKTSIHPEK